MASRELSPVKLAVVEQSDGAVFPVENEQIPHLKPAVELARAIKGYCQVNSTGS